MSSGIRPAQSFEDFGTAAAHMPAHVEYRIGAFPGMCILAFWDDAGRLPELANRFVSLLAQRQLPRFAACWRGGSNCHSIVNHLQGDLTRLGIEAVRKLGWCGLVTEFGKAIGKHSFIEVDGVALDAAGAGSGIPVKIQRATDYYKMMRITDVRDRAPLSLNA